MDTSETYIKMCAKAEEIQKLRKDWIVDDVYYVPYCSDGWIMYAFIGCSGEDCGSMQDMSKDRLIRLDDEIWLPRQDQLQEMIHTEYDPYFGWVLTHLMAFYNEIQSVYLSMEQLWLAFIMKEKYNKIWNGTDWK